MDVLIAVLLCVIVFLLYLLNESKKEILRLNQERRDNENRNSAPSPQIQTPPLIQPSAADNKIFVSVIFKEGDQKYYDYLLGNNRDVTIGDFVEVYFNNKISGKVERRVAKVIYVSEPGEVSEYARSNIKCKADRPKW